MQKESGQASLVSILCWPFPGAETGAVDPPAPRCHQLQAGPRRGLGARVHPGMSMAPESSLQSTLLPQRGPFRKFPFLSPAEDIHHFPQQRRGSLNSFLGFIKYVQEPICSCQGDAEGEPGSPFSCAAALAVSGAGDPFYKCCSVPGRAEGPPQA